MSEVLWTEIAKIDLLRERMGVNYEEARKALREAGGDVALALGDLERKLDNATDGFADRITDELRVRGARTWDKVQSRLHRFNNMQVNLKRNDKTLLSVSAPLGLLASYVLWRRPGLRLLGLLGATAAVLSQYEFEIESGLAGNAESVVRGIGDAKEMGDANDIGDAKEIGISEQQDDPTLGFLH